MEAITFGQWAKKQRKDRGWSLITLADELARVTGRSPDPSLASKVERGVKTPGEEVRGRYHEVFGTTDDELIRLGIVVPVDEWGRPVKREQAPTFVNPFPANDPRHNLAQLLTELDLTGPYRSESLRAISNLTNVLSRTVAHQHSAQTDPVPIDTKAMS